VSSDEILRRLKVLFDMPAEDRPISIYRLEKLAKLYPRYIYAIVKGHNRVNGSVQRRLGRALELVENGQVIADAQPREDGKKKQQFAVQTVRIVDKKNPPQKMARKIVFTKDGPKVVRVF
jgi:hypothetical protein